MKTGKVSDHWWLIMRRVLYLRSGQAALSLVLYVLVALMWLLADKRIERVLVAGKK